jgi:hypothetical protein
MSGGFQADLVISGPVLFEINDPTLVLHFCDYLTFEENLAIY